MSFADALDIAAHPTKWWARFIGKGSGVAAGAPTRGLISQLTPDQRARIFDYDGPIASGCSDLPKAKRRIREAA
jgi:hypothetical protein